LKLQSLPDLIETPTSSWEGRRNDVTATSTYVRLVWG
jgi:hypothetical protein